MSNAKNHVLTSLLPCFEVNVKGRGQGHESRSNLWCTAVDIKGLALPSAAKSNKPHYQCACYH